MLISYVIPIHCDTDAIRWYAGAVAKQVLQLEYIIKQSIKSVSM